MIRPSAALLLPVLWFSLCGATRPVPAPVPLTLDAAISRAMDANPRIRAAATESRARGNSARAEDKRWLGELGLTTGAHIGGDETLIRPITPGILSAGVANMPFDDRSAFWTLAYQMPLYSGGSLKGARQAAHHRAAASRLRARRTLLAVRHQVVETYVGLLSADAQLTAWEAEREALDSLLTHIRLGYDIGKFSRVDLLKVQVQHQQVLARVHILEMAHQTRYATLLALLGEAQDPAPRYTLVPPRVLAATDTLTAVDGAARAASPVSNAGEQILVPAGGESRSGRQREPVVALENLSRLPPLEALVDSALARRSDLQALEDAAAAARAGAVVAHGKQRPQIRVAGRLTGTHGGSIDYDDTFWSVDATMTMPLLDMGRRRHLSRQADLNARRAELQTADLQGRIRAQVAAARAQVTMCRRDLDTQRAAVDLAAEISRLERLKYDSGRGDIDNLLRARSGWRLAVAALIRARHELFIALDNLQLTTEGENR